MTKIKTAMEYQKEALIKKYEKKGIEKGTAEGKIKGSFELALKIKKTLGIKTAQQLSNFTTKELKTEKINKNRFLDLND